MQQHGRKVVDEKLFQAAEAQRSEKGVSECHLKVREEIAATFDLYTNLAARVKASLRDTMAQLLAALEKMQLLPETTSNRSSRKIVVDEPHSSARSEVQGDSCRALFWF